MKFVFHIQTSYVGSKYEEEFEIPDEDLEGLSDAERFALIDQYARDIFDSGNWGEWGWEEQHG